MIRVSSAPDTGRASPPVDQEAPWRLRPLTNSAALARLLLHLLIHNVKDN